MGVAASRAMKIAASLGRGLQVGKGNQPTPSLHATPPRQWIFEREISAERQKAAEDQGKNRAQWVDGQEEQHETCGVSFDRFVPAAGKQYEVSRQ